MSIKFAGYQCGCIGYRYFQLQIVTMRIKHICVRTILNEDSEQHQTIIAIRVCTLSVPQSTPCTYCKGLVRMLHRTAAS